MRCRVRISCPISSTSHSRRWNSRSSTFRSVLPLRTRCGVRQRNPTATFVWKQTTYPRAFTSPLQADLRDYSERALNSSQGSVDKAEAAVAARAARTSVSLCRDLAFPATYTPLIEKLNQAARELFAPMGVLIWEDPALMTFNAPGGWIDDSSPPWPCCWPASTRVHPACLCARRDAHRGAHRDATTASVSPTSVPTHTRRWYMR
jgi:hypothetical protein